MNVFEIVSLKEAMGVERVPGQNMWRVIYPTEMNRIPDIMPTQEKAQARYDQEVERWNNSSKDRQRQEREQNKQRARNERERAKQLAQQAKADKANDPNLQRRKARWLRAVSRALTFGGIVVVSASVWERCVDLMMRNYRSYMNGAYGNIDMENGEFVNEAEALAAQTAYHAINERAYGTWCATIVIPLVIAEFRVALGTWSKAKRLLRWARSANLASSVAMGVGGPVGIAAGIAKWIIFEGIIWAVIYAIWTSDYVKDTFASWVSTSWLGGQLAPLMADIMQIHGNFIESALEKSDEWVGWDTSYLQNAAGDVRSAVGMDDTEVEQEVRRIDSANGTGNANYRGTDNLDAVAPTGTTSTSDIWLAPDLRN